jgi:ribosomal protein S27E
MKCPECGDDKHLYRNAEVRWDPDTAAWEQTYVHYEVECTKCEHQFDYEGDD